MNNIHKPVLLQEAIKGLNIKKNGTYIDATFGFGGHAKEILKKIGKRGKLIGIEIDSEIYAKAKSLFKHCKNLSLYNCNFIYVDRLVLSDSISKVDGILFDLGINVYQIKKSVRGFSFLENEKLDMRFDSKQELDAYKVINYYSQEELEKIFKNTDERKSRQIAKAIVESRKKQKIRTTFDLVEIIEKVKKRKGRIHPATLVFMALRIEVNKELENLEKALENSLKILRKGGRIVVISFHSGEDRIVKHFLKEKAKQGILKIVNKKVIKPSWEEIKKNPLARSAKLRIGEMDG